MAKKFKDIPTKMTDTQRQRAEARAAAMQAEMPLHELRRARELTQTTLSEMLGIKQANVSKIEQRTDLLISTLRRYVEALGGTLEVVARFPEGSVQINQFAAPSGRDDRPAVTPKPLDLHVGV